MKTTVRLIALYLLIAMLMTIAFAVACTDDRSTSEERRVDGSENTRSTSSRGSSDDHANEERGATRIRVGSGEIGNIESEGDVDMFRFVARMGYTYSMRVQPVSLSDTVLVLVDENGRQLAINEDSDGNSAVDVEWTAPKSGGYYLQVMAGDRNGVGTYRVELDALEVNDFTPTAEREMVSTGDDEARRIGGQRVIETVVVEREVEVVREVPVTVIVEKEVVVERVIEVFKEGTSAEDVQNAQATASAAFSAFNDANSRAEAAEARADAAEARADAVERALEDAGSEGAQVTGSEDQETGIEIPEGPALEGEATVIMADPAFFDPEVIKVKVGTTVTWENPRSSASSATSFDGEAEQWDTTDLWKSSFNPEVGSASHTFQVVGCHRYRSEFSGDTATGAVCVVEAAHARAEGAEARADAEKVAMEESAGRLAQVQERGKVICASRDDVPGYGSFDDSGRNVGFDIDLCRAVATAVLGDPKAIEIHYITAAERGPTIQSGEVDLLVRTVTWTTSRDAHWGNYAQTMFYDGQGFMVPADLGVTSAYELGDAAVCVASGTTTELNMADFFRQNNMDYNPQIFEDTDVLLDSYKSGACDVFTNDRSQLAALRTALPNPSEHMVLPETISEEPLGPVVPHGDDQWFDIVKTVMSGLIYAEAYGINSGNVFQMAGGDNIKAKRLLGTEGTIGQEALGLSETFMQDVIYAVGNYGEIYDRNLGPDGIDLPREGSRNALWSNAPCTDCPKGGQIYAAPLR